VRLHALDVSGVAVLLKSTQTFTPAVPDWHMCAAQLAGPSLPGLLNTVTGLIRLGLVDVELAGTRAVGGLVSFDGHKEFGSSWARTSLN
jgi:hypothetical protein